MLTHPNRTGSPPRKTTGPEHEGMDVCDAAWLGPVPAPAQVYPAMKRPGGQPSGRP
jgi:hypothetical protein